MATAIVDVDEFTTPVMVPEPGDDRTAQSVRTAFQALSNRTRHAQGLLDGFEARDHVWLGQNVFEGDLALGAGIEPRYLYLTPRKVMHSLRPAQQPADWTFAYAPGPTWVCSTGTVLPFFLGPQDLPSGATLTGVRALVDTAVPVTLTLDRITYDTTGTAIPTDGGDVTESFTPTGTQQHIFNLAMSALVNNANSLFRLILDPASGGSCVLRWIELAFSDPGPRNF